ncbi:hypothetical protein AAVH_08731 [Aphelenchoides avenae]|nr:hypothetical protein AAVH_08731 [Aphelenchus avenae]
MKELLPDVGVVHCQFHLAQNLLKHIREKGLIDVFRNEECRLLLRSLWALAFLPPDEVVGGYEALVVALNVLNNREVIPVDRLADLQCKFSIYLTVSSTGKLSKFLIRLQVDEEQTRQLLDRLGVFPAEPARGRRRHKAVIRDSQIRTMVTEYNALAAIDRTAEAKLELLRRIQFHLTA